MIEILAFEGYGPYIWTCYIASIVGLGVIAVKRHQRLNEAKQKGLSLSRDD